MPLTSGTEICPKTKFQRSGGKTISFDTEACGARIRELRKGNKLTQEKLAEELNITDSHLRRIDAEQELERMQREVKMSEKIERRKQRRKSSGE